jgi:hypothetical protein
MSGPITTILLAPSKVTDIHANTTDDDPKFDTGVATTPLPGNTLSYAMSTAYTETNAPSGTDINEPTSQYHDDKRIYAFAETGISKEVTMHIANLIEGTTYKMIVTDSTDDTEAYTPKNRVKIITFKYVNNDIVWSQPGNSKFYVKTTDMSTDHTDYVTADRVTDTQYTESIHTNIARIVVTGTNVYNGAKLQISISSPSTVTESRTEGQAEADIAWCSLAFSTNPDTAAPLLVTGGPLAPNTQYLAGVAAPTDESKTDVQWIFDRIGFPATEYQEVAISKVHLTYTAVDTLSATEVPLAVDMLRVNPPNANESSFYVLIPKPKENETLNDLTPVTVTTGLSPVIFDIPNGITSDGVAKEFEYAMAYEDENGYIGPYSGSESALKLSDKPGRVNDLKVTNPPPVSGTGNVTLVWKADGYIAKGTTLTKFKVYYKLGSENVAVEGTTTLTATESDLIHELKADSETDSETDSFSFDISSGLYTAMIDATATTYSASAGPDDKYFFWVVPVATKNSDDTIEFTGEPSFPFSLGYDSSGIADDAAGYDTPGGLAVAAVPTAPIVQTAGTNVDADGVTLFVGNDNSAIDAESNMSQRIGITVDSSVLSGSANGTDGADIGVYYRVFSGDVTGIDKDTELPSDLGQTFTNLLRVDNVFTIEGSVKIYTSLTDTAPVNSSNLVNGTGYIVQVAYGYMHTDDTDADTDDTDAVDTLVISELYTSGTLTPSTIPAMSDLYETGTTDAGETSVSINGGNPNGFITDDNHESTAEIKLDFDYSNPILFGGLSVLTTLNVKVRREDVESYRTRDAQGDTTAYIDKSLDYNADGEYTLTSTDFSNIAHGALYNIQLGVTSNNGASAGTDGTIDTITTIAKMGATYTGALTKLADNDDGSLPTSRDSNGDLAYHLEFYEMADTENTGGYAADYYRLVGVQEIDGALVTVVDEIFANPIAAASRNQGGKVSLLSSGTTGTDTGTGTGIAVPIGDGDSVDRNKVLLGGSATSTPSDVIFNTLPGGHDNNWMKDGADGTSTTTTVKIDTDVAEPGQAIHYAIIPYAAHTTIYPTLTGNGLPGKPFVHPIKNDVDLRLVLKDGDARIDGLANDTTITGQTGLKVSWKPASSAVANATIKSFEVTLFTIADIKSGDISYIDGAYALANGKVRATRIGEIIAVVASNQDIETVYNHTFDDLIVGTPYIVRISTVLEYGTADSNGIKDTKRTPGVFAGSSTGLYSASVYAEPMPGSDDNLTYPVDFSTSKTEPKLWIPTSTPGVALNRNKHFPGSATLVINNSGSTITHASMVQIFGPSGPPSGVTNGSNSFVYDLKTEAMADGKVTPVASGTVVSITGSDLNNAVYTYSMLEYTIGNDYLGTDWSREQNYIFVANVVGGVVHDGTLLPP